MTVHVGDVGTVVTQAVTEADNLASSGASVVLRIRRPDGSSTSVAGIAAPDHVEAVIGAGVWTLPGTYQLQFEVTVDATSFALDRQTAQVQSRISAPAPPLSVDELRSNFLRGLPMEDPMTRVPFPDSFYEFHIQAAVAYLERMLDIPLTLRTIEGERTDFLRGDYQRWGWLQLTTKPVVSVERLRMVLPVDTTVIEYPLAWLHLEQHSGVVRIVPGTGAQSIVALGLAAAWAPLFYGTADTMPDVFSIDYTAGFSDTAMPYDLKQLIGLLAAIGPLAIAGDLIFGPGLAGSQVGLDTLMTNIHTTKDSGQTAFASRIRQYQMTSREMIKQLRLQFHGVRMVVA